MGVKFTNMVERVKTGWCDWVHPKPGYLMKCCDCGLVHEVQFKAVRVTKKKRGGWVEFEDVEDPDVSVVFRAKRVD